MSDVHLQTGFSPAWNDTECSTVFFSVTRTNPRQASASQPPSESVWSPWLGVCQVDQFHSTKYFAVSAPIPDAYVLRTP